ncbi:nitroreductase family protein [Pseudoxanthobacter sp.]|uniref:nitroreductase family protein n=1 Tax=Pseudoxanthobacter sp. TaxID=1925742 RepID=UPI002FE05DDE
MTEANSRAAEQPINPVFLERWSPRAMTGEPISREELLTLFEAARWAPSAYNAQPWRFIYALRDTPAWETFLNILIPFNQGWAKNAAALVVIVSDSEMLPPGSDKPVPSHSHSFDAGAAWASLALQAVHSGLAVHGMTGIDFARAAADLGVPASWRVEAAVAIGKQADKSVLPEGLAAREAPSGRKPLAEIVSEGRF